MTRDIFWHLNQIPICLSWIYFYHGMLTRSKRGSSSDLIRTSIAVIAQTIIGIIIAYLIPDHNFLRLIINSFVICGLIVLIRKAKIKEAIFCYVINLTINIVIEVLSMLGSMTLDTLIHSTSTSFSFNATFYILNDVLCLLAYIVVVRIRNKQTINKQKHIFEIIMLLILNQFAWIYWVSYYIVLRTKPNVILTCFVLFIQTVNIIVVFILIKGYARINKEETKTMIKNDNADRLKRLIMVLSDKQNVINNIYLKIENENIEMIELNKMTNELKNIKNRIYCDSPVVNALLSYFYDECSKIAIKYTVNVHCSLQNNIDDFEFNTLLSNILKNALESCERYVNLEIDCKNNTLVIKCQNDCANKRKTMKMIHGNGIHIINNILDGYGGNYNLFIDNNIATSVCILNIN